MPFSLSLFLQDFFQKKVRSEFDKSNKVLTPGDIDLLSGDQDRLKTLSIFKSAVVDHHSVNGTPYHLKYPLEDVFYHDGFKKAMIADNLSRFSLVQSPCDYSQAEIILSRLTDPKHSEGYVRILAWNSWGVLAQRFDILTPQFMERVIMSLKGTSGCLTGTLVFLDRLVEAGFKQQAVDLFQKGISGAQYRVQRALLEYYRLKRNVWLGRSVKEFCLPADIHHFIEKEKKGCAFSMSDVCEGCREVGLIASGQTMAFWEGTQQAQIRDRLMEAGGDYIRAIGSFLNQK